TVWAALPERAERLGIVLRRLDWEPPAILDFVAATLENAAGTWVLGVYGAVAEVMRSPEEPVEIRRDDESVVALTPRAALRITARRGTRAMAWREAQDRPERIVLALPKVRLEEPGPAALTALGPDRDALMPGSADQPRVDLGLGRAEARFTIRSGDQALIDSLSATDGTAWPDHLAQTGAVIQAASPHRVIETPLGRAEIDAPIPAPAGRSPDGPHTHLLPDLIAQRLAVPPLLAMPSAFAAGAIFYPAAGGS
ncbi:MAG: hypothetical protein AAFR47_24355, partial [Pseudomonadota bacterium]